MLGMWWDSICDDVFAEERNALDEAIRRNRADLDRAKTEQRRAEKAIERFTERFAVLCEEGKS